MTAPLAQLAKRYDPAKHDPTGYIASWKLDGVRALWDGEALYTRHGHRLPAPAWFTEGLPRGMALDGEIFAGHGNFSEAQGACARKDDPDAWRGLAYQIFDSPSEEGDFADRLDALHGRTYGSFALLVPQRVIERREEVAAMLEEATDAGAEGLMLRLNNAPYRQGKRNAELLKVKMFKDAEAKVVGHDPGAGRHEGRLGALVCEREGVRFRVGSGFTDAERDNPPPVGATITFACQEFLASGKPRFPVFLRVREDM